MWHEMEKCGRFEYIKKIIPSFCLLMLMIFSLTPNLLQGHQEFRTNTNFLIPKTASPNSFISLWNTSKVSQCSSENNQIELPLESGGNYDFFVDWGDGTNNSITNWNQIEKKHTYSTSGVYMLIIDGKIIGWRFENPCDSLKLVEIQQWGCLRLGNSGNYFEGCLNLKLKATDNLNLTGTTNLYRAFAYCINLIPDNTDYMSDWDVSHVVNMSGIFSHVSSFNQPIEIWNVSNVKDMSYMFSETIAFNKPLGNWDVSSVISMKAMFFEASIFNQPIDSWNVSNVMDMEAMFYLASDFNQHLSSWDTSNVVTMHAMFFQAFSFNQPLDTWNVSNVTDMGSMFYRAFSFNQPLDSWDVSQVTTMFFMFAYANSFDQDLGAWNVSNVRSMGKMFLNVTLSTTNFDYLLLGWSELQLQMDVEFCGGNSKYSTAARAARRHIIKEFNWNISDGGMERRTIPGYNVPIMLTAILAIVGISIIVLKTKHSKRISVLLFIFISIIPNVGIVTLWIRN